MQLYKWLVCTIKCDNPTRQLSVTIQKVRKCVRNPIGNKLGCTIGFHFDNLNGQSKKIGQSK